MYDIDNDELKDLNIIISNSGFTSILDVINIKFDKNIYMNINGVDREKLKQSVMNEIINNPKIIDNY